jgi:hypothetical protein
VTTANSSGHGKEEGNFRYGFAVLESLGQHAKGKSLSSRDRFFTRCSVRQSSRKRLDLGDPASILFMLELDG